MAGYIGTTPVPQATQHRESFTATGGQTSFATAGYTPQFIDVYLNGVKLAPADYTATNGSDVVLATGATASDILEIVAYTPFEVANQTFTGDTSVTNLAVTGTFTSRGIDDNADAVAITIDSSENVGIGTSSPSDKLHVDGSSSTDGILIKNPLSGSFYNAKLEFTRDSTLGGAKIQTERNAAGGVGLSFNYTSSNANEVSGTYSEAMRIDSSGNVGIGTAVPNSLLSINNASDGDRIEFQVGGTVVGKIGTATGRGLVFDADPSPGGAVATTMQFRVDNSEAMRIDSSGSLLINRTSKIASEKLSVKGEVRAGYTGSDNQVYLGVDTANAYLGTNASGFGLKFEANGSEAMRLDASGNLLVGKTSGPNYNVVGVDLTALGEGQFTVSSNPVLQLNRQSTDGDIAVFRKDGATVGSIGAFAGDFIVGSSSGSDAAFRMDGANNAIYASNTAGAARDAAIDLGASTVRWKDLYLSGGVYLGGTGAANKLDDYEEGTWTPTLVGLTSESGQTYATQQGDYTKIGNQVICRFSITMTAAGSFSGGYILLSGLPFTIENTPATVHLGSVYFTNLGQNIIFLGLQGRENDNKAYLWIKTTAGTSREYPNTATIIGNTTQLTGTFTFQTTA